MEFFDFMWFSKGPPFEKSQKIEKIQKKIELIQ